MQSKLFCIILLFILNLPYGYTRDDGIIKEDSLNLCILMINYESYEFEGGNISYYKTYSEAETDTLPFKIEFNPPMDVGRISFLIKNTGDTILDALIVWMGSTHIFYPTKYSFESPFVNGNIETKEPAAVEYFDQFGSRITGDTSFINKANRAWLAIDSMEVVRLFAEKNFKAGIFFLPDDYCIYYPSESRWVVFLYYNDQNNSINDHERNLLRIFPNPTAGKITIEGLKFSGPYHISILNLEGQLVYMSTFSSNINQIDISSLPSGAYFVRLKNDEIVYTGKFLKE